MAVIHGVLVSSDPQGISLAAGSGVITLLPAAPLPGSLRPGDEVAGWRRGPLLHDVRLARLRTDWGWVAPAGGEDVRLLTAAREWRLAAPTLPGHGRLRICHDGVSALWATDGSGGVWLPPEPATTRRTETSTRTTLSAVIVSIASRIAAWAAERASGRKTP